jgi:hypothetical protein
MTTRKGFKRLVRDRMAKTGERYAAARRALLAAGESGPATASSAVATRQDRGLLHPNSASIATVLASRGVVSPISGAPLSEALIHGIAGGAGAGYILWEFLSHRGGGTVLTLGFTNQWQYPGVPGWFGKTLERLGVPVAVHETGGAKGARETLDRILEAGEPAIAFVEQRAMGTWGLPDSLSGHSGYPVVVTGRTADGGYLVDDRGAAPLVVSEAAMSAARARIGSWKHRLLHLRPDGPLTEARLRAAIEAGLADQVAHLSTGSDSFGLPAWRKWARMMTDTRNAKAWPRVFADGNGLFAALLSIVELVDGGIGPYGGHLRELQGAFLDEAAAILDRPALRTAADAWRAAGDLWEDLADAAVPADLEGAAAAVEADEALHDAVMAGEPGRAAAREAAAVVWATRDRYAGSFPLPASRIQELFADLGRRLEAIHAAEVAAVEATRLSTVS